jgi:hypothetical protein
VARFKSDLVAGLIEVFALREQGLIENLVAADKKLGEVAAAEGLSVLNPDPALPA